jgi:hypothetical protein
MADAAYSVTGETRISTSYDYSLAARRRYDACYIQALRSQGSSATTKTFLAEVVKIEHYLSTGKTA